MVKATIMMLPNAARRSNMTMNIKELREQYKLSRQQFCDYFRIPYRTLQDWELENRKCPDYVVALIAYMLEKEGLINQGST